MRASLLWFVTLLIVCLLAGCEAIASPAVDESPTPAPTSPGLSELLPTLAAPAMTPLLSKNLDDDQLSPPVLMHVPRAAHSATLLADGRVLIAGGFRQEGSREIAIAGAEIYDPRANTFTAIADMNEARSGHTATRLPNGRVLIVGGWGPQRRIQTAELYDPASGTFDYTGGLSAPRAGMTATLLPDGRVLILGGDSGSNDFALTAEIYDPHSGQFSLAGDLIEGRVAHTATQLKDGRVLLVGGSTLGGRVLASAEIYDPATGESTPTGSLSEARYKHAAALLPDGRVLVVGGSDARDWQGKTRSAEIFDPRSGVFQPAASLNGERFKLADAIVVLPNGDVLVGGGNRQIEIYRPAEGRFVSSQELDNHYYFAVTTLLADGSVLISGGYDTAIQPSARAWIYSPGDRAPF